MTRFLLPFLLVACTTDAPGEEAPAPGEDESTPVHDESPSEDEGMAEDDWCALSEVGAEIREPQPSLLDADCDWVAVDHLPADIRQEQVDAVMAARQIEGRLLWAEADEEAVVFEVVERFGQVTYEPGPAAQAGCEAMVVAELEMALRSEHGDVDLKFSGTGTATVSHLVWSMVELDVAVVELDTCDTEIAFAGTLNPDALSGELLARELGGGEGAVMARLK